MYLLLGLMFAIIYGLVVVVASMMGITGFLFYGAMASFFLFIQYMIGPRMVDWSMRIQYVSEREYPELHRMIADLAQRAGIPKPRVGIAKIQIPNAFAFGRSIRDGRVCVTDGIIRLLTKDELKAVIGHEIAHIKNRDVAVITLISIIPMICWYIAWSMMFSRDHRGNAIVIGIFAFVLYFITNLLVMYGSRIREYYADLGSVKLGNDSHLLASALYKLAYGNARVPKETLKQVEGNKAFFISDPSRAWNEIRELKQIDRDMSGCIDRNELMMLRGKKIHISTADKLMELFSTHPNMLKRINHLFSLT